jgi:hypothetical protein
MKILLTENQFESLMKRHSGLINESSDCEKDLFDKINNWRLKAIFKDPINKIVKPHAKKWAENNDRQKYDEVLTMIGKSQSEIDSILDMSFVYDEGGNWDRINKLNTNYSDTARFIIDIFKDQGKNLCDVYKNLSDGNNSDLTNVARDMSLNPTTYWDNYLSLNREKYTQNNKRNSMMGDTTEKIVVDYLLGKGWKLVYQSKEGSPIDTKLSIDIIMLSPDNKIAKIQVKTVGTIKQVEFTPCEKNDVPLTNKKQSGGYSVYTNGGIILREADINLVAYVTMSGNLLILRKYSPVTVSGNKCVDTPVRQFPSSPKKGLFFVDHESVVFSKIK